MKYLLSFTIPILLLSTCGNKPAPWEGPVISQPRDKLTAEELLSGKAQPLLDMSFFAQPAWGKEAAIPFSGTLSIQETELVYPKDRAYYPGENIFPNLELDFLTQEGELIPRQKEKIRAPQQNNILWDVVLGTGKVWQEDTDGPWSRASFPLTLTDKWVGQARNCVATFVYQRDTVSNVCLQCSQETADIDDQQLGNISGMLPASFLPQSFPDSTEIIAQHQEAQARRLPVYPLSEIDLENDVADYFDKNIHTNASTSLGALLVDDNLYLHPPQTRHGPYPYPAEMRHALYSVTKSMAGALALMYFEERYEEDVFGALITDYVPALADYEGWQGVTFSHTLNMVTGTVGSDRLEHFFSPVILAETAEEAIQNVAQLGDAPELPGQRFNYASANSFVLSYALQQYVEQREGEGVNYWDLVHENVLVPIGAEYFSLLRTREEESKAIPVLGLGALPTIDEAAKIALLFANLGNHNGQQLLHRERVQEVFGQTAWPGHSTNNDFRGSNYQHAFWSQEFKAGKCRTKGTYMLGFGENYIVFLPSGVIVFRFLDEHDLDIRKLIKAVEGIKSSCGED